MNLRSVEGWVDVKVKENLIFRSGMKLLRMLGISQFVRKKWLESTFRKDVLNPNKQMRISNEFFRANEDKINEIVGLLADEKSKEVYRKAIDFRTTHNIQVRPPYSIKDSYFVKDIIHLKNDEVFVDCGAFIGDTIDAFCKANNNRFKRVVSFEPDDKNYEELCKKYESNERVVPIKAGVWNKNTTLFFSNDGSSASKIQEVDQGVSIEVQSIDENELCKDATFIKMDIEGSEMEALIGARNTIINNHPKLAICIYHSDEDYIRIPLWIHEIDPSYKLYVRHHSFDIADTVLYAV